MKMRQRALKGFGAPGVLRRQRVGHRRNLRDLGFLYASVAASVALAAVVFVFLWSRLMFVNIGYEISKANSERSQLIEKNRRLRLEFMRLKSPERIEKLAIGRLGLVRPSKRQIVHTRP